MSSGGRSFHKEDWTTAAQAAAAVVAAAYTGGTSLGLLGGAGATGAAGAGAAGLGAAGVGGAAAGAGGTALGTAGMFGAEAGLASGVMAPTVTPMLTGLGAATPALGAGAAAMAPSVMGGAGAGGSAGLGQSISSGLFQGLGGMGGQQADFLAMQNAGLGFGADKLTLDAAATAGGGGFATPWGAFGKIGKGLQAYQRAQSLMNLAQGPQQTLPGAGEPPGMRNRFNQGDGHELKALADLLSNPVGQARLQDLLRRSGMMR